MNSSKSAIHRTLIALPFFFGFILGLTVYYPGIMTADSDYQLSVARSLIFTDWHPILMPLIWRLLDWLLPGPFLMLALQNALYWLAFGLLAYKAYKTKPWYGIAITVIPFLPFTFNLVGTIWKDILATVCILMAFAIYATFEKRGKRKKAALIFFGIALLLVAVLVRHNVILATIPIAAGLLGTILPARVSGSLKRFVVFLIAAAAVMSLLFTVTLAELNSKFNVKKAHVESATFIFDILGMSKRSHEFLLPGEWSVAQQQEWTEKCFSPRWWDQVWIACSKQLDEVHQSGIWDRLGETWVKAIMSHPIEYAEQRLSYFGWLFSKHEDYMLFPEASPTSLNYGYRPETANLARRYVLLFGNTPVLQPLFTMGFWIVSSSLLLVLVIFVSASRGRFTEQSFVLASAAWLYSAPLVIIGPSVDLRYVYFTICATCICTIWLPYELRTFR